ncbi:MAG: hypothetical protein H7234_04105 [Herminiimonas sp.]|nr:hypothetical protein [Herminiimonas sp.]
MLSRLTHQNATGVAKLLIAAAALAFSASSAAQEISVPEKLLFQSNHFDNIKQPTKLNYTYRQEAAAAPDAFSDDVMVDVLKRNDDGTASVAAQFLTGTHAIPIPPIDHAQGNPAILGFLERDILEMKRLTGGATAYFRKRIRLALASPTLPVRKVDVVYNGAKVAAQEITIHPYSDDPLKDRFGKFADKGYVFIISEKVPGSLYRVYTTVKGDQPVPTVDASMTIARGDPAETRKTGFAAPRS